jgi:hypothetical protein
MVCLLLQLGCGPSTTPPTGSTVAPNGKPPVPSQPASPADALLEQVAQRYQSAHGYSDQAQVTLSYNLNGRQEKSVTPLEVVFARPNKLRLKAYQITAAADGKIFRARVSDPSTNNIDSQFVERELQDNLSLADLQSDTIIHSILANSMVGYPLQLDLLISDQALLPFREAKKKELLTEAQLGKHLCQRLKIHLNGNYVVFWIDKEELLLRRVEFPTDGLLPTADAFDVKLTADFNDAEFIPKGKFVGESKFKLIARKDAKLVRYFVELPAPLPAKVLGAKVAPFALSRLDGSAWTGPVGRVRVLTWFRDHPACEHTLKQLQSVYAKSNTTAANVVSLEIVSSDPISITSNERVQQKLTEWNVTIPAFRDEREIGNHVFHISELPTLVVLDGNNRIQFYGKGYNPELTEQLPVIVDKLNRGEDLAQEVIDYVASDRTRYQQEINAGGPPMIIRPKLAPQSKPKTLIMRQIWQRTDIAAPGNIVAAKRNGGGSLFVVSQTKQIVELGLDGKTIRESRPVDNLEFNFLRYGSTQSQSRLVASSVFGKMLAVFDSNLNQVGQFPTEIDRRLAIGDAAIGDLDGDGKLDIAVGLTSAGGVIRLDENANPAWQTPHKIDAISLRLTPLNSRGRQIVATTLDGQLAVISADGQSAQKRVLRNREVFGIMASARAGSSTSYCGITYDFEHNYVLLGMNDQLQQVWEHPLAKGAHVVPVQFIACGDLLGSGHHQWVAASPDGTIDVISDSADFFESFGFGDYVTGIEVVNFGQQRMLVVASAKSVTAFSISRLNTK